MIPRDIRKLMSNPFKGNSTPSSIKKTFFKSEINNNGKTYREVGKHIVYYLSKVSHSFEYSLVDRGSNGVVAGNYVRVIFKYPGRTVDVCGIDNHEIMHIPLVTADVVILTTSGEVFLIIH